MKNIFTAIAVCCTAPFFAQTHEIVKHNGEKLDVNFIKIENNLVHYSNPNSAEQLKISRYAVAQVKEKANNNSKVVSEKILFAENPDYKKVVILKESEAIGLKKVDDLTGYLGVAKGETTLSRTEKGRTQLKQKAAAKGQQFIVITSNERDNLKAVGYTY